MDVVKETAARELDLAEPEVDGDSLGDVEEPTIRSKGDGKAIKTLEDVGSLMFLEDVQGKTTTLGIVQATQG